MKQRILIVTSSPRVNGNSTLLALKAAEGVKSEGVEADIVHLRDLQISPCNACDACRVTQDSKCVIEDDMQALYQKIKDAEGIIFATPVYWFNISAQMKLFIDRTYSIHGEDSWAFTGKKVGVLLTYADKDVFVSGGINALRSFQDICNYVKANMIGMVYGSASKTGDVQTQGELMQQAYNLGRKIVKNIV